MLSLAANLLHVIGLEVGEGIELLIMRLTVILRALIRRLGTMGHLAALTASMGPAKAV